MGLAWVDPGEPLAGTLKHILKVSQTEQEDYTLKHILKVSQTKCCIYGQLL